MSEIIQGVQAVGTLLGGIGLLSSMGKDTPPAAPLPQVKEPPPVPSAGDDAARRAGVREMQKRQQSSGRLSTFLSDSQRERLGG